MRREKHRAYGRRAWTTVAVTIALGVALGLAVGKAASVVMAGDAQPSPIADAADAAASAIPEVSAPVVAPREPDELPSSGFNTERYSLDDADSPWVVVNKARPLEPESYVPDDLVSVPGVVFTDGGTMRREAADALSDMSDAATARGSGFRVSNAYRDYGRQGEIYDHYASENGTEQADQFSARPGFSEHQTGWSADLYDTEACRLKVCFGSSDAGSWVAEHGADYGFIVRYPEGSSEITGYKYEPWHVRYVGVDLATEMREQGVETLEEFFDLPPAPKY
ncbi:M15 family metallopeptidase [Demequina aurantiaca]|uniref:M15 family metallopeptidase n=1 Tax=Demequina aurantiaca TaxID=676200 RepID=UPI003D34125B